MAVSRYFVPQRWLRYDGAAIAGALIEAKTAAGVLNRLPYLPQWIEQAHEEQLRLEAVGTTRIEGAEFTQREQDEALAPEASTRTDLTRSQRQLRAANAAYRWIRSQPADRPVTPGLVLDIHRRIVTGCDDDHCEPGALRRSGANVTFGNPVCRGAEGGDELAAAFDALGGAIAAELRGHDPIVQAMAAHYHVGAMHPFDDGNGRTARALEAFMLRRAGVNDMVMVSLSNYYYEHINEYLAALSESRSRGHDLTPFLRFTLPAVAERCDMLAAEIATHNKRVLYREFAQSLFGRLRSPRRRALAERQMRIIEVLLDSGPESPSDSLARVLTHYEDLKYPERAFARDLYDLLRLSAVTLSGDRVAADLDWPRKFSESELLERYERMPPALSAGNPAVADLSWLLGRRRR